MGDKSKAPPEPKYKERALEITAKFEEKETIGMFDYLTKEAFTECGVEDEHLIYHMEELIFGERVFRMLDGEDKAGLGPHFS